MSMLLAVAAAAPGAISGTTTITFGQTGVLRGSGRLIGASALTFGQTGVLRGSGRLIGASAITFAQTGVLRGSGRLVGASAITFAQAGTLRGSGSLAGAIPVIFGQTGLLRGSGRLVGSTPITFGQTGTLSFTQTDAAGATGGWPIYYPRRKPKADAAKLALTVPSETDDPQKTAEAVAELAQQTQAARRELRRAEQRDQRVTAQLRAIYAAEDAKLVLTAIAEDDDADLEVILLALA
jgi:hypothetical protein